MVEIKKRLGLKVTIGLQMVLMPQYRDQILPLARLGKDRYAKIQLINSEATPMLKVSDQSELYAYEIVNFVNGQRTVGEIRDAVSAEYGAIPVSLVTDYLQACAGAGVIRWK